MDQFWGSSFLTVLFITQFNGNTEFDIIYHPVYGPAACIVAKQQIEKGEELYVNYNYRIKWAPDWYKEAYKQHKKDIGEEQEEV